MEVEQPAESIQASSSLPSVKYQRAGSARTVPSNPFESEAPKAQRAGSARTTSTNPFDEPVRSHRTGSQSDAPTKAAEAWREASPIPTRLTTDYDKQVKRSPSSISDG